MAVSNRYGPDTRCERIDCRGMELHTAGRHLDPRDKLYDGPGITLAALPHSVRGAAYKIIRDAPDLMPELIGLARALLYERERVAQVRVDGDRKEHRALLQAKDCEQHGEDIEVLGRQIIGRDRDYERVEAARVALLALLEGVLDLVNSYKSGHIPETVTVDSLMSRLDTASKSAIKAHDRAWKK